MSGKLRLTLLVVAVGLTSTLAAYSLIVRQTAKQPFRISGNSMTGSLYGHHAVVLCPGCNIQHRIEPVHAGTPNDVLCPNCHARLPLKSAAKSIEGDLVLVDSEPLQRRGPQRGEIVSARDPEAPDRLVVKRVVGLPGDTIGLRDGELLINGTVASHMDVMPSNSIGVMSHTSMKTVYDDRFRRDGQSRWASEHQDWQLTPSGFETEVTSPRTAWLTYKHENFHPGTEPGVIYDDDVFNTSVSRSLNVVHSVLLTADMRAHGNGAILLRCVRGDASMVCEYQLSRRAWIVQAAATNLTAAKTTASDDLLPTSPEQENRTQTSVHSAPEIAGDGWDRLAISMFLQPDHLRCQANDDVLDIELHPGFAAGRAVISIGARQSPTKVTNIVLRRPPFISVDQPSPARFRQTTLAEDEYFLLGDNSVISRDSRHWPRRIHRNDILGIIVSPPLQSPDSE